MPTLTGEDIYLKEDFIELGQNHAVDMIQPDLAHRPGGILETKKIGDACQEYGVPMAMHLAGSPVSCMANVHCAAATENFLVLENHSVDVPWWDDLVNGVEKPIINKGFINVPDGPGLGITLNEEVIKQHLLEPAATSSPRRSGTRNGPTTGSGADGGNHGAARAVGDGCGRKRQRESSPRAPRRRRSRRRGQPAARLPRRSRTSA